MKRDGLVEAARALRESAEREAPRADETRARVMATLRAEQARRLTILRVAVPLAAVLVGSLAWAAAAGKLPSSSALFAAHQAEPPPAPQHRPTPWSSATTLPPTTLPPELAMASQPAEPGPAPPEPLEVGGDPQTPGPPAAPTPAVPSAVASSGTVMPGPERAPSRVAAGHRGDPQPPSPSEADDEALYTRAHRLHFVDHDPGAALAAWDTYLHALPRGRFALESRYNRALCLVRLGRRGEAAAALDSFAKGVHDGYRQTEARALLEAMGSAPP